MSVRRIVPDIRSKQLDASRQFYADVLGLEVAMDMGFIVTLVSPTNPTAQVTLMRDDESSAILPQMSVEVADVDDVHARAVSRGFKVVYPLTNEPSGCPTILCDRSERHHHQRDVPHSWKSITLNHPEPPLNFNSGRDNPFWKTR